MEKNIFIVVYRTKNELDKLRFRANLSQTFPDGAAISDGVYLIAGEDINTVDVMKEASKNATGSIFVAPLQIPYSSRGFSTQLDKWFERNGKQKVHEAEVREFLKKIKDSIS